MPKGEPNAQTKATERYQKKAGYITKGFKLKKDLCDEFAAACERTGESQASAVSAFMREYIKNNGSQLPEKSET